LFLFFLFLIEGVEEHRNDSDSEEDKMKGAKNYDKSKRKLKNKIECRQILFSPSEDSWVVATSEGLFVYGSK
jgi:predicted Zn-dependent protease